MRGLRRICFLLLQLSFLLVIVFYLVSLESSKDEEHISLAKRRALDTVFQSLEQRRVIDNGNDSVTKKETIFAPLGPDETPPGMPAVIPKVFPIEESDFCRRRPKMDIIAYVHSTISRVKNRRLTRETWANATAYNLGVNIGTVFMVGRPKNKAEKRILMKESNQFHDIVQGDYADHYRLLSYKGLAGLYWVNKNCPNVSWTLHVDDDVYIDVFLYFKKISELHRHIQDKMFICSHMYGPVLRTGRWYVSFEQYPQKYYPLYCSGGAWFLKTNNVPRILEASKSVPFLWVDDAYITGLLANHAGIRKHGFQQYYGHPKPTLEEVGKMVVWFYLHQSRVEWWDKVLEFHENTMKDKFSIIKLLRVLYENKLELFQ